MSHVFYVLYPNHPIVEGHDTYLKNMKKILSVLVFFLSILIVHAAYAERTPTKAESDRTSAETIVHTQKKAMCQACNGAGYFPCKKYVRVKCKGCRGTGKMYMGDGKYKTCSVCKGSGVVTEPCPKCKGSGKVMCKTCKGQGKY